MKLNTIIFVMLFLSCNSSNKYVAKTHSLIKRNIQRYAVMIPSDSKIGYYNPLDSPENACINYGNVRIQYSVGGFNPQYRRKGENKILRIDTLGGIITRLTLYSVGNDTTLFFEAWDTTKLSWPASFNVKVRTDYYGIIMGAEQYNSSQQDTVMEIFNSLTYTPLKKDSVR